MTKTINELDNLLGNPLLKAELSIEDIKLFPPREWLPRIIELGIVKPDIDFYKKLAKLYGLDYLPEIDIPLNPKDSIAYQIPTEILIKAQLYPFIKNGKIFVATSTPFIDKDTLDDVLSYTGRAGYKLIMTTPFQLREALKMLYYIEFSTVAEGVLKYLQNTLSASPPAILRLAKFIVVMNVIILLLGFVLPKSFLLSLFFAINIFYIYLNILKLTIFIRSINKAEDVIVKISDDEIKLLEDQLLPRYTILSPLRFEANMVKKLVSQLDSLDYPKSKLEIMFLVGVDDQETIAALKKAGIDNEGGELSRYDNYMSIVKVPKAQVDTKPLVCNYGLRFATGDYTVIYDAEDRPDVDQLKKAVLGFQSSSLETVCLQGKLNFYNSHKNLLTKFFSLEYGMWYDYFLPGLQSINAPIPLGGTSNHFITKALRKAGEWDPYNVTEDADLGMRIYRNKHRTRILDTCTLEEATSSIGAWLKQRSRWEKGYLATLVVHARHPITLYRDLGFKKFIHGLTVFFGNFYMPFINPLLWVITILYILGLFNLGTLPAYIWAPAVFNLVIGNLIHIAMHLMAAIRQKHYDLAPLALILPLYWILISIATYIASWDILTKPYQWVKTRHGNF